MEAAGAAASIVGTLALTVVVSSACMRDINLLKPPPGDAGPGDGPLAEVISSDGNMIQPSCQGLGAPVRFATATGPVCAATLAARAHRMAICSCGDWYVPGSVQIMSNASIPGKPPAPAGIGINGSLISTADMTVPGSVYVSGTNGVTVTGRFDVTGSLRSAGSVNFTGPGQAMVGSDVYAVGDVIGPARIGGTLHLPPMAVIGSATIPAATVREPVAVAPPCDCAQPFDVSAAIAAAMATNDNAARGYALDRLANLTAATSVDLPCGVYAFSNISSQAQLTLVVHGHVLIAVAGDVFVQGMFGFAFDPGAEVDLLLQGSFTANASMLPVGNKTGELIRIWMKGPGPISLPNGPILGAIVQAPQAAVMAPRGLLMIGSITAASLTIGGAFGITYDDALLASGTACGDPPVDPLP